MLRQFLNYLVRPIASPAIEALYRTCVTQARQPFFYAKLHVRDTVDGRFDLLILHVLLVIQRLYDHPTQTQELFDILFADMDKSLREMGVSDISISKKMKPMLAAFYGRAKAYEHALLADDHTLFDALQRNIYSNYEATSEDVMRLTTYVRDAHTVLAGLQTDRILAGHIHFPEVH